MLYRVQWLIDIDAVNSVDAAREARRIHRAPHSTAVVFRVALIDPETSEVSDDAELIDLAARGYELSAEQIEMKIRRSPTRFHPGTPRHIRAAVRRERGES